MAAARWPEAQSDACGNRSGHRTTTAATEYRKGSLRTTEGGRANRTDANAVFLKHAKARAGTRADADKQNDRTGV